MIIQLKRRETGVMVKSRKVEFNLQHSLLGSQVDFAYEFFLLLKEITL